MCPRAMTKLSRLGVALAVLLSGCEGLIDVGGSVNEMIPRTDAASTVPDSGLPAPDAASTIPDSGLPAPDAASTIPDSGLPAPDAASTVPDSGLPAPDAATSTSDASTGGDPCAQSNISIQCAFVLINQQRAAQNPPLPAYALNAQLDAAAATHNQTMTST